MDQDGNALLSKILDDAMEEAVEDAFDDDELGTPTANPVEPAGPKKAKSDKENHSQWALGGNGRFMPVGSTVESLPSGIYEPFAVPGMWGVERLDISSDGIYRLPDMATEEVLKEVNTFWDSENRYRDHNLLYKRGLILWGPPGGGKTVTVKLLMNELVKKGGLVIVTQHIPLTVTVLKAIRRIEPVRNLIVVLEDIDEIIRFNGESVVLSMLDGENNIDNVLTLATTNFPERLGARIINRPSRFDRRIYVGMPNEEARRSYLQNTTNNTLSKKELDTWVKDTENMSIAHLRELVAAVFCLGQPYSDVIDRLVEMAKQVQSEDEFKRNNVGFGNKRRGGPIVQAMHEAMLGANDE